MLRLVTLWWPIMLGLGCWALAPALPVGVVWAQAAAALMWSAPPVCALVQALWALGLAARRRAAGPLVGLCALPLVGAPWAVGAPAPAGALRVAVLNVNAFSPVGPAGVQAQIAALELDVLVLVEHRLEAVPGLVRVAGNLDQPLPRPSYGTTVWCRGACAAWVSPLIGSDRQRMPLAVVALPAVGACLLGVHAPPPAPLDASGIEPYTRWLAAFIEDGRLVRALGPCPAGAGVVVAGDLNHVPGSDPHRRLVGRGLRDLLWGRGLFAASWPAGGGFPALPVLRLDHVLVGAVGAAPPLRVDLEGSDHRGFVVELWPSGPG